MSGPNFTDRRFEAIKRKAEALGASRDPLISALMSRLEGDPPSSALAGTLDLMLADYEAEHAHAPNHLATPPALEDLYDPHTPPDFVIGRTTETGVPYGPRIVANCGSLVVGGITGGGKTTAVQNIIVRLHTQHPAVAIIVFDVKGDFTCVACIRHPGIRVHRLREELRLRWIQPPKGVPLDSWLARVATYICEYRGLKKSRHLILDALKRLCSHFGVDQDPTKPWPSLHNLLDYLAGMKGSQFGKDAEYRASLINELRGLLDDSGRVFDTADGIDVDDHLLSPGGITVLRMETLPAPAQQVIISLVIERMISMRVARNVHNVPLEILVIIDEAQQVLSRRADFEAANGVAPLAVQLLRGRESGVGFIVAPHLLQDISQAVLASAKTLYVVGGLSDATSIGIAGQMMNLPYEARTMIPRLGRGQALVREMGQGNYTDAFLVDLDPPVLAKNAIDEPTRQRLMAPKLAGLPSTPSRPLTDYPSIMAEQHALWNRSTAASSSRTTSPQLAPELLSLLHDACRYRDDWMKDRRARLNVSDYKIMMRHAQSLESGGLARVHDVRLGRTTYTLIEVADKGWQILGLTKPPHYIGHGGFIHTVLISRVARFLKATKWANVQSEFPVGPIGHPVDVYGRSPNGVPTAFEITISTSNVTDNARKTLSGPTAIEKLIFLCPLQGDCKSVENIVRKDPTLAAVLPKIQFRRVDEFIS